MTHQTEFVISLFSSLLGSIGAIYTLTNEHSKARKNKVCFDTLVGVLVSMLPFLVFSSIEKARFNATGSRPENPLAILVSVLAINGFYSLLFWNALLALEWFKQVHRQVTHTSEGMSWIWKFLAPLVLTIMGSISFPKNSFIAAVQLGAESRTADPVLALWTKYLVCMFLVFIAYVYIGIGYLKGKSQLENRIHALRKYSIFSLLISTSMSPLLFNGCVLLFTGKLNSLIATFECFLPLISGASLGLVSWHMNKTEEPAIDPWISQDVVGKRNRAHDYESNPQPRMILTEIEVEETEQPQPEGPTLNESIKEENEILMISSDDASTPQTEQHEDNLPPAETNSRIEELSFSDSSKPETISDENHEQSPEIIQAVHSGEKKPATPESGSDDSYTVVQKDSDTPTIITKEEAQQAFEEQKQSEGLRQEFKSIAAKVVKVAKKLRKSGLKEARLILAIDCTLSNIYSGKNLHELSHSSLNLYEKVISIMGSVFNDLSSDGKFPVYLFGDKKAKDKGIRPLFTAADGTNYCNGAQHALNEYRETLSKIEFSEPASFKPIVEKTVESYQETRMFHTLIIVGGGVLSDVADTIEAIKESSKSAIEIIVVGLGGGDIKQYPSSPWEGMEKLVSELQERKIGNFSFIQFAKEMQPEEFAEAALKNLPESYNRYKDFDLIE